jgi:ribosomal protein L14E/L6E/L27E
VNTLFDKGQIVFSKAGRDKGGCFVVAEAAEEYVYIVDGKTRKLSKPKKKKNIHIQPTHYVVEDVKNKLESGAYIQDSDIRTALSEYKS